MSDIFISYASVDRTMAQEIACALSQEGWSVWWDRTILPGKTYDEVIEHAIKATRCMIVVWSQAAVDSKWVRAEADEGQQKTTLIPVRIEDVLPPLAFRQIQAADLIGWAGDSGHAGFRQLVDALTGVLGPPASAATAVPATAASEPTASASDVVASPALGPARRREDVRSSTDGARWVPWVVIAAVVLVAAVSATGYGVSWWYERTTALDIQTPQHQLQTRQLEPEAREAAADQAAETRRAEEKAQAERTAAEQAAAQRAVAEKAAAERAATDKAAAQRVAAEKAATEKAAAERAATDKAAAQRTAAGKAATEKAAAEKAAAARAAAEKSAAVKAAAERAAAEKAAAEKATAQRAAEERAAAARAAAQRALAERTMATPRSITLSFGNFQTRQGQWSTRKLDAFVVKAKLEGRTFSTVHYQDGLKIYLDGFVDQGFVTLTGSIYSDSSYKSIGFKNKRISLQDGNAGDQNIETEPGLSGTIAFDLTVTVEYR